MQLVHRHSEKTTSRYILLFVHSDSASLAIGLFAILNTDRRIHVFWFRQACLAAKLSHTKTGQLNRPNYPQLGWIRRGGAIFFCSASHGHMGTSQPILPMDVLPVVQSLILGGGRTTKTLEMLQGALKSRCRGWRVAGDRLGNDTCGSNLDDLHVLGEHHPLAFGVEPMTALEYVTMTFPS